MSNVHCLTTEAVRWFRKATQQGDSVKQSVLGVHCALGQAVLQDCAESYVGLIIAKADMSSEGITDYRDELINESESYLTNYQLNVAQIEASRRLTEIQPRRAEH